MNKSYTLGEYTEMIEKKQRELELGSTTGESAVCDAMSYSLSAGGKRIRPVLLLEFCRLCSGDVYRALPFACAVESLHTYSLIHDDLPCMDDDDMRRGKPSCHVKFGEANALLAGDALLTRAFELCASCNLAEAEPLRAVKAIALLSSLAGANGMIGGQCLDLSYEGKSIDIEKLRLMDSLKTGCLIKASCQLGVILAGGSEAQMKAAGEFAENLGQAFQIVDDILDVEGDEELFGKPVGSDSENNKSTYVTLLGLEESKKIADSLSQKAKQALELFGEDADFLRTLCDMLLKRKS